MCGLTFCVLLGLAWIVSDRWVIARFGRVFGGSSSVTLDSGEVRFFWFKRDADLRARDAPGEWWVRRRDTGSLDMSGNGPLRGLRLPRASSTTAGGTRMVSVDVPLWLLIALLAGPTLLLWQRERRRPRPGHCPCGYDLAGLALEAVCPECGRDGVRTRGFGEDASASASDAFTGSIMPP